MTHLGCFFFCSPDYPASTHAKRRIIESLQNQKVVNNDEQVTPPGGGSDMRTAAKMKPILVFCLFVFISLACAAQKPGSMNIGTLSYNHWPPPSPSILRIRGLVWSSIETSRGTYSPTFGSLDNWIAVAKTKNTQLMYTFLRDGYPIV